MRGHPATPFYAALALTTKKKTWYGEKWRNGHICAMAQITGIICDKWHKYGQISERVLGYRIQKQLKHKVIQTLN